MVCHNFLIGKSRIRAGMSDGRYIFPQDKHSRMLALFWIAVCSRMVQLLQKNPTWPHCSCRA